MPKLNRELIRGWLEDHNWTVARLTAECNAIGDDNNRTVTGRSLSGVDRPAANR